MNKGPYKERKVKNRCFDFLGKQNIIVPLILDINGIPERCMAKFVKKGDSNNSVSTTWNNGQIFTGKGRYTFYCFRCNDGYPYKSKTNQTSDISCSD